jgi:hypothetical protein
MDQHRSGNNNPVNPISKVAALQIERDDSHKATANGIETPLAVNLTFNLRRDMTGVAVSEAGVPVTVTFSLGIKRAALVLEVSLVDCVNTDGKIRFSNIASIGAISTVTKNKTVVSETSHIKLAAKGKAGGSAVSKRSSKAKASGVADVMFDADGALARRSDAKVTTEHQIYNVNATTTGTRISWSIEPAKGHVHLVGGVFHNATTDLPIAAKVVRNAKAKGAVFEVDGSVRAMMQDLEVTDVVFTNALGSPVVPGQLDHDLVGDISCWENKADLIGLGGLRSRIIKEILRRHLKNFDLDTSSAHVEICKAKG